MRCLHLRRPGGVSTAAYLPFCFFNLFSPLLDILYGYIGFKVPRPTTPTSSSTSFTSVRHRRPGVTLDRPFLGAYVDISQPESLQRSCAATPSAGRPGQSITPGGIRLGICGGSCRAAATHVFSHLTWSGRVSDQG